MNVEPLRRAGLPEAHALSIRMVCFTITTESICLPPTVKLVTCLATMKGVIASVKYNIVQHTNTKRLSTHSGLTCGE